MMGDMASDGSLTAMYMDQFGKWRMKCNVQVIVVAGINGDKCNGVLCGIEREKQVDDVPNNNGLCWE